MRKALILPLVILEMAACGPPQARQPTPPPARPSATQVNPPDPKRIAAEKAMEQERTRQALVAHCQTATEHLAPFPDIQPAAEAICIETGGFEERLANENPPSPRRCVQQIRIELGALLKKKLLNAPDVTELMKKLYQRCRTGLPFGKVNAATSSELTVNTTLNHYRVSRSLQEGIDDLYGICETATVEDCFTAIEYDDGSVFWHEIGERESNKRATCQLDPFYEALDDNTKVGWLVHPHPKKGVYKNKIGKVEQTFSSGDVLAIMRVIEHVHNIKKGALAPKIGGILVVPDSGYYTIKVDSKKWFAAGRRRHLTFLRKLSQTRGLIMDGRSSRFDYREANRSNFGRLNAEFAALFSWSALGVQIDFIAKP